MHPWRSARMQCAPLLDKCYGCLDVVIILRCVEICCEMSKSKSPKCLVFHLNVRLGIDKLIDFYHNIWIPAVDLQMLRLSDFGLVFLKACSLHPGKTKLNLNKKTNVGTRSSDWLWTRPLGAPSLLHHNMGRPLVLNLHCFPVTVIQKKNHIRKEISAPSTATSKPYFRF